MESGERRFGEREFSLILRKAAELQERDAGSLARSGLTLGEIEAIAAEAGIEPKNVRAAALTLKDGSTGPWRRILGPPAQLNVQTSLDAQLGSAALAAIVDAAQAETGRVGSAREVLGGIEWTGRDTMGAVHVTARLRGKETRIQVSTDRKEAAASIATLAPIGGLVAGGIIGSIIGGPPIIVASVAGLSGLAAGRILWGTVTRRWQARIEALLGRVTAAARAADSEPTVELDPPGAT